MLTCFGSILYMNGRSDFPSLSALPGLHSMLTLARNSSFYWGFNSLSNPNASLQRWFSASEKNCKKKKGRGGRDSHLCRLLLHVLTFLYFLVFFSSECSGSFSVCILFQVYSCCQWEDWTIEAYTVILEFESTVDFWVFCVSTSCINCPPNIFVLFFFHVGGFFFF